MYSAYKISAKKELRSALMIKKSEFRVYDIYHFSNLYIKRAKITFLAVIIIAVEVYLYITFF